MIGIIDYSMGNLRSVEKAFARLGFDAKVVAAPAELAACDKLILPGVGAFEDAMIQLRQRELVEPIRAFVKSGKPFLGICLGLQLLFDVSYEDGEHEGLGILPGRVVRFALTDTNLKVPHMGWNALQITRADNPLLADLPGRYVYFVHSYYAEPAEGGDIAAGADYGGSFCASVWRDNVWAAQFHPEKSQRVGLKLLENFAQV